MDPAWPPAPADTTMMPSTPAATAFFSSGEPDDVVEHEPAVFMGALGCRGVAVAREQDRHLELGTGHVGFHALLAVTQW